MVVGSREQRTVSQPDEVLAEGRDERRELVVAQPSYLRAPLTISTSAASSSRQLAQSLS